LPYVSNRGVHLYWETHGSGPPVLLIMGLSFTLEMWFRILPYIQATHQVIVFDNRGIGRSDVPAGPYTMRTHASDAIAVLDAAGVSAAHVIGASMGGMIAQELALGYPDRVLSLGLGCTSYSGVFAKWPDFRRGPRGLMWLRLAQGDRDRALRQMIYADSTPEELIEEDIEVRSRCRWTYKGVLNQLAGILMWSSYRRLPAIRVPTLVVHGEEDHLIPIENGRRLASRIPRARFEPISKAGHILMTDQPEETLTHLLRFLREANTSEPQHSHAP
jgi:3-oxoadipate enol-lactonase